MCVDVFVSLFSLSLSVSVSVSVSVSLSLSLCGKHTHALLIFVRLYLVSVMCTSDRPASAVNNAIHMCLAALAGRSVNE